MPPKIKPLILGISGTSLIQDEIDLFNSYQASGFILFSRNIESRDQVTKLTHSLKQLYPDRDVPIFVDQEGGRVARLKPPIVNTLYPSARYFAKLYEQDKVAAKEAVEKNYYDLTTELLSLGINSPCAPVCDIFYQDSSNVIGDRSFGSNVQQVIDLCRSTIYGIINAKGIPFIKHIPGHGRATVDSHFKLPIIDTPLIELEETDFKVFKELSKHKVWGMTAHIKYTSLDSEYTATTSPIVIKYIRDNIQFTGKLVCDDICMYALHGNLGETLGILNKVSSIAKREGEWQSNYLTNLIKIFDDKVTKLNHSQIIDLCHVRLSELKPKFLVSLNDITKMAINAGCDLILHCSGDIDEMRAVCKAL